MSDVDDRIKEAVKESEKTLEHWVAVAVMYGHNIGIQHARSGHTAEKCDEAHAAMQELEKELLPKFRQRENKARAGAFAEAIEIVSAQPHQQAAKNALWKKRAEAEALNEVKR